MNGFHNPTSAKPNYAGGLSELANMVMQFLAISKMGQGGQQKMPQMPQSPQMPQPPGGMMGNRMMPGQGPTGPPSPQPISGKPTSTQTTRLGNTPVGDPTSPRNMQLINEALVGNPAAQAAFLAFVGQAKLKDPFAQTGGQSQGQPQRRMG